MSNNNINADKTMLRVGTTLERGKYRIDRYLSSGGFGNTYLATNISFDEKVAIKEFFMKDINMRAGESTSVSLGNVTQMPIFQEQMEKFKTEAKRLRKLKHKNIVEVSDLFDENGTTYYVMDFIDGQSLRDMVQQRGKLVEQEVRGYLEQTLDALEVVHQRGFYHLDIKPANIMVDKTGRVRVIDFGASKQQTPDGGATSRSAICYTLGYAPIEQKDQERENFGPWTDLYALGATLYNVLTGQTPPSTSKIADYGEDAFKFPSSVSDEMKKLILWMMKGRRFNRPQSVADVKAFLKDGVIPEPKVEIPIVEDDDATILNPPISEPDDVPEEPKEEGPKEEKPKKEKPKEEDPPKKDPIVEIPSDYAPGSGKRKLIYAASAAVVVAIVIFLAIPKSSDKYQLTSPEDVEIAKATPDSVTNKAFKNDVLGEYLYTGPVNANGQPNGIGRATFIKNGQPNGTTYSGPIADGVFDGDDAEYKMANGDIFKGSFKNNYFSKGSYTNAQNGEYFNGIFSQGQPSIGAWYNKQGQKLQEVNNQKQ